MNGKQGGTQALQDYHRGRAEDEMKRAELASSACAKRAHSELAMLHVQRARALSGAAPAEGCTMNNSLSGRNTQAVACGSARSRSPTSRGSSEIPP